MIKLTEKQAKRLGDIDLDGLYAIQPIKGKDGLYHLPEKSKEIIKRVISQQEAGYKARKEAEEKLRILEEKDKKSNIFLKIKEFIMKKLLGVLVLVFLGMFVSQINAQSYSFFDNENSILFGSVTDTVSITKGQVAKVWYHSGNVEIISGSGYVLARLKPSDYGYGTDPNDFRRLIDGMADKEYLEYYTHTAAGNIDTVYNTIHADTVSYVLYGYDANDSLISRQFLPW